MKKGGIYRPEYDRDVSSNYSKKEQLESPAKQKPYAAYGNDFFSPSKVTKKLAFRLIVILMFSKIIFL